MKRRDFIKTTAPAAVMVPSLVNGISFAAGTNPWLEALAQSAQDTDRVLVLIFLSGGNDGLNTVIPKDQYSQLAAARSNVLIPENQVLALNGYPNTGFHPSMTGMRDLFNQGKLQVIQSVGYPQPNFSHFRSTDIYTSASDSDQVLSSGWVGRYLETEYPGFPTGYPNANNPDPLAVQLGANLPLLFQGPAAQMSMTVSSPAIFDQWVTGTPDPAPNTPAGDELTYIRNISAQTQQYAQRLIQAYLNVSSQSPGYPAAGTNYLADVLKLIARLIKGGLQSRIYLCGLYGFDTHATQVVSGQTTTGVHANLLQMLSQGMKAFQDDLQYLGIEDRVLGMTFSEFGRRVKSNASTGTDHGAAGPMFVFGKKIHGGVLGTNPTLPANATDNDNLPMQYDFRSVYASVLKDWFCVPENVLQNIMLQNFQYLPIVNPACITSIQEVNTLSEALILKAYPNPMVASCYAEYEVPAGHVRLDLYDPLGRLMKTFVNQYQQAGTYKVWIENENYPIGNYHLRLQSGPLQKTTILVVAR
ncbi:MAG: DUF1501 domain-containing protein [Flavobacteriales bacterium]|nr:DUF1501 domain-containing protein [Flavobacteriales bacterium]